MHRCVKEVGSKLGVVEIYSSRVVEEMRMVVVVEMYSSMEGAEVCSGMAEGEIYLEVEEMCSGMEVVVREMVEVETYNSKVEVKISLEEEVV